MLLIDHVVRTVLADPIFILLLVGLLFILIALVLAHIPHREPTNDKYLPQRSVNSINERYNKYDWK